MRWRERSWSWTRRVFTNRGGFWCCERKSRHPRGRRRGNRSVLLRDLVDALAGFGLRRFDFEPVFLGGGGEEAPNAVGLPVGGLHGVDQQMHLGRRVSGYFSA